MKCGIPYFNNRLNAGSTNPESDRQISFDRSQIRNYLTSVVDETITINR
ncbi:MAG: hypothetical protein AAGM46_25065 [Cyanobacteria bacterium J06582_2]